MVETHDYEQRRCYMSATDFFTWEFAGYNCPPQAAVMSLSSSTVLPTVLLLLLGVLALLVVMSIWYWLKWKPNAAGYETLSATSQTVNNAAAART